MSIRDNYLTIRENMETAAARAGRSADEVKLIAVTKFVEVERIAEAIDCGADTVGENRVQELTGKLDFFRSRGVNVNLIGQLQTNKVKYIVGKVDMIQSVDRLALAQEIDRLAVKNGVVQDVMIEVNIGEEAQKGGIAPQDLPGFLEMVSAMNGIRVKGLMCIPPAVGEEEVRPYFARMRTLFETLKVKDLPNVSMEQLSMGMSGDYMAAIAEGATMIRVGTALFGARQYAVQRT
ncbi:MAG: YggS family pyridoxal phosphate-dependent enzyme [Clostridia bacterium]|nr:YggS family pyridoxal phosphate-dependent enzyme [Clostridia bacterium]MBQ6692799.1 YggS family pyridoxal phosphate-dependent enzyme [Clostridia bacterium]